MKNNSMGDDQESGFLEKFIQKREPVMEGSLEQRIALLQHDLRSCMMARQFAFCLVGVSVGIPISIKQKSFYPFATLGVLGSFMDYSYPYCESCIEIKLKLDHALAEATLNR